MSSSGLNSSSLAFVEELYRRFLIDPCAVAEEWRAYFENHRESVGADGNGGNGAGMRVGPSFQPRGLFARSSSGPARSANEPGPRAILQHRVDEMIRTYRIRGHLAANVNPLTTVPEHRELRPEHFGIDSCDMDQTVSTVHLPGPDAQTVRQVYERMRNTYCQSIGAEVMHIDDLDVRQWLFERLEVSENRLKLDRKTQVRILRRLTNAAVFERFIQKKYLGAKSFSLEGAESLIPLLDLAIEKAARQGAVEIVLAMAHRGRLNVLTNILGKSPHLVFREFEDSDHENLRGGGDVKYHLGHSSDWTAETGEDVHLSLCFNPSHLEFINPVALGRVRAKQDRLDRANRHSALPVLIHGDAAFAGEGVVQETLNLSHLDGYTVGGALHIVLNNQIGFTTPTEQARSSDYATDVAKMLPVPIFHVNGEEPEAVAQVVDVALDFRERFQRDVVIDMYCYRRRGHNEGDEPAFTQPLMYRDIRSRPPVSTSYLEHLLALGEIEREEAEAIVREIEENLEEALTSARNLEEKPSPQAYGGVWIPYRGGAEQHVADAETGLAEDNAAWLLQRLTELPEGFQPHPRLQRFLDARREMASGERPLDWSASEALAMASLVAQGTRVRLSGQDCQRGTFSQRHAVLHDIDTDALYCPLEHISAEQAGIELVNSPLSEAGVLGFDYGYSLDSPDCLVAWEAQFGDFSNAAQVVIDQFMTSAEDKWQRLSGIVLLLPHGFEGQGPEHSSARLERWLTLAAEDNIRVAYPSTPAQYFHLLRRQVLRPLRKPLVVMTPKSLLRHPAVVSTLEEHCRGTFHRVLPDTRLAEVDPAGVRRVLLCTGKIYHELAQRRAELGRDDVAIVRLEQLYPMPSTYLSQALAHYANTVDVYWVQEEPRNMGAWPYLRLEFASRLLDQHHLYGIYRPESASPATGSSNSHKFEQEQLLEAAFQLD